MVGLSTKADVLALTNVLGIQQKPVSKMPFLVEKTLLSHSLPIHLCQCLVTLCLYSTVITGFPCIMENMENKHGGFPGLEKSGN